MYHVALFSTLLLVSILIVYPFIHKWAKKIFNNVWVWFGISVVIFIFFLYVYLKYIIIDGIANNNPGGKGVDAPFLNDKKQYGYYEAFGDASFTAICGFIYAFLPLMIIFNPSRKFASVIAPCGFVFGLIVSINYIFSSKFDTNLNVFEAFFINNYSTIFKHFFISSICYIMLFNIPEFEIKAKGKSKLSFDLKLTFVFFGGYFIYCFLASLFIGLFLIKSGHADRAFYNCTGIWAEDFTRQAGTFSMLSKLVAYYDGNPITFYLTILMWSLMLGGSILVHFIFNKIKKYKWFKYEPPRHYYKKNIHQLKWNSL